MALLHTYPTGPPQTLIRREDLSRVEFSERKTYWTDENGNRKEIRGLAQVCVLPPPHPIPFLGIRMEVDGEGEQVMYAICRTCAKKRLKTPCPHTEEED